MDDKKKFQQLKEESVAISDNSINAREEAEQASDSIIHIKDHTETEQNDEIQKMMRLGFIRKVYGILSVQLLITAIFCSLTFFEGMKNFILKNEYIFWMASVFSIVIAIPLLCFKNIARTVPYNYIFLMIWTMCEAYLVACVCAICEPRVVVMAAFCTLGVTLGITVYALTTKQDFTFCGGFLFSSLTLLLLFSLFSFYLPVMNVLICIMGVFIYSLYLLYDTQLIFGKVGLEYNIEDYILASLNIYLDIIQVFLYLLQLIATISSNN
jgi:FtsH-binding integral membrane protein